MTSCWWAVSVSSRSLSAATRRRRRAPVAGRPSAVGSRCRAAARFGLRRSPLRRRPPRAASLQPSATGARMSQPPRVARQRLVDRWIPRGDPLGQHPPHRSPRRPPQTAGGRLVRPDGVLGQPLVALPGEQHAGELGRARRLSAGPALPVDRRRDRGNRGVSLLGRRARCARAPRRCTRPRPTRVRCRTP